MWLSLEMSILFFTPFILMLFAITDGRYSISPLEVSQEMAAILDIEFAQNLTDGQIGTFEQFPELFQAELFVILRRCQTRLGPEQSAQAGGGQIDFPGDLFN